MGAWRRGRTVGEGARFLLARRGWGDMTRKEPKQRKTEMSKYGETDMRAKPPNGAKRMRGSRFSQDPLREGDGQNLHKQPISDTDAGLPNLLQSLTTPCKEIQSPQHGDKDMEVQRL